MQHLHMLQARVTFSRGQIHCYVTIYAICCETTSNKTRVSPKHKARVNANMRLVKIISLFVFKVVPKSLKAVTSVKQLHVNSKTRVLMFSLCFIIKCWWVHIGQLSKNTRAVHFHD